MFDDFSDEETESDSLGQAIVDMSQTSPPSDDSMEHRHVSRTRNYGIGTTYLVKIGVLSESLQFNGRWWIDDLCPYQDFSTQSFGLCSTYGHCEVIRFMPYLFLRKTHIFMVIYHGMIIFHGGSMFVDFVGYPCPQIMSIKEMNWLAL